MQITEDIPTVKLTRRKIRSLIHDSVKCAEAINLVYVNDRQEGITRRKKGKDFAYYSGSQRITDPTVLRRIKALVIPPAWQQVWICVLPEGHLQATGIDTMNRKQYRYHPGWNMIREQTKYAHLYEFGCCVATMRKQLKSDLSAPGLPLRKVLATIVSLMDHTGMRVGCGSYEKMYGSFGITTLKNKHVTINGAETKFSFRGKKGVSQDVTLKSRKLSRIIRQCMDIPGKELFQYLDESGERKHIDSGMVNSYIKDISGKNFSSKDFRTWVGTLCAVETFKGAEQTDSDTATKKVIVDVIDTVAKRLGNTRAVCRKYYIHPAVVDHYAGGTLRRFFEMQSASCDTELSSDEVVLMKILEEDNRKQATLPVTGA